VELEKAKRGFSVAFVEAVIKQIEGMIPKVGPIGDRCWCGWC